MSGIANVITALLGFYGVAAGAAATHLVADPQAADSLSTAAIYALVHAVLLISWREKGGLGHAVKWLFILGVALFSGSITLAQGFNISWAGALAPVGGGILLLSWLLLAAISIFAAFREKTAAAARKQLR